MKKIATADVTPVSISSIVGAMPKTFLGQMKASPLTRKCGWGGRRLERRRLGQCTDRRENIGIPLYHPPTTLSCLPVTSLKPRQRNQYHPHRAEELEPSN